MTSALHEHHCDYCRQTHKLVHMPHGNEIYDCGISPFSMTYRKQSAGDEYTKVIITRRRAKRIVNDSFMRTISVAYVLSSTKHQNQVKIPKEVRMYQVRRIIDLAGSLVSQLYRTTPYTHNYPPYLHTVLLHNFFRSRS